MRGINFKTVSLNTITLFVSLLLTFTISGQSIKADSIPTADFVDTVIEKANSYFYFDLSFTNNNINSKEYQSENIPATLLDISFYEKSGLWASIMPVIYHNTSVFSYDLDFMVGYQKFFANYFDVSVFYTNHNYSGDTLTEGINYQHAFNLSVGVDFSWIYFFAEGYSNHGTSNNYFSDFGVALYKDFDDVFTKNDYISIMPLISTTFGTDYWFYDDYTALQTLKITRYLENSGYDSQSFGYLGLDLILSLTYQINNIGISASYSYNVPGNKYKKLDWENQSGIMLSINYLLNLK